MGSIAKKYMNNNKEPLKTALVENHPQFSALLKSRWKKSLLLDDLGSYGRQVGKKERVSYE